MFFIFSDILLAYWLGLITCILSLLAIKEAAPFLSNPAYWRKLLDSVNYGARLATPSRSNASCQKFNTLQSISGALACALEPRIPKSWFTHFYIVGFMVNSGVLLRLFDFGCPPSETEIASPAQALSLSLFHFHVSRRLFECLYQTSFSPTSRMNIAHYALGITFYCLAPFTLVTASSRSKATCVSSPLEGLNLLLDCDRATFNRFLAGTLLLLFGSLHQNASHAILAGLRSRLNHGATGSHYFIPRGGFFEFVSCPHYLMEVIIYVGLALVAGPTDTHILSMVCFVTLNLSFTARETHSWYRKKFKKYPRNRKAMIPWLW